MVSLAFCGYAQGHLWYDMGRIPVYPTEICSAAPQEPERTTYVANVSAYTASDEECGKSDGITASGTVATEGRTIAAPSWIPFGTTVIINGHSYVAEDRGGAIQGNCIDIYMDSREAAMEFGRKELEVTVVW